MKIIKCSYCGEPDLSSIGNGQYKCGLCGSLMQDDQIEEIKKLLESSVEAQENYIGNLRHRLTQEMGKSVPDVEQIKYICNKILDQNAEDVSAKYFIAFAKRSADRQGYIDQLDELAEQEDIPPFAKKRIANYAISYYEPYAYDSIKRFLDNQQLDDFFAKLDEAIEKYNSSIDQLDPTVLRDVMIYSHQNDEDQTKRIADIIERKGYSCWYAERNLDTEKDKKTVLRQVAENTKGVLLVFSQTIAEDKQSRDDLGEINGYLKQKSTGFKFVWSVDGAPALQTAFFSDAVFVDCYTVASKIKDLLEQSRFDDDHSGEKLLAEGLKFKEDGDIQKSIKYLEFSAQRGNSKASYQLGECYFKQKSFDDAARWFKSSADSNNPEAQRRMAVLHMTGKGVEKSESKSFEYFLKAAKNGVDFCQYKVACCYKDGKGTIQNDEDAFVWFKKAADNGSQEALFELGLCYWYGKGITINKDLAKKYFERAASIGDENAKRMLNGY